MCTSDKSLGEDVYRNIGKVVKFSNALSVEMSMQDHVSALSMGKINFI